TIVDVMKGKVVCANTVDYSTVEAIQTKRSEKNFIVNVDTLLEGRMIKDENEIYAIAKAAKVLDDLYEICTHEVRIGLSERALQAKIIFEAMQLGSNAACQKSP